MWKYTFPVTNIMQDIIVQDMDPTGTSLIFLYIKNHLVFYRTTIIEQHIFVGFLKTGLAKNVNVQEHLGLYPMLSGL